MKKIYAKKQHFTILEMFVSMGLLSVILFALLSMLDQSQKITMIGISKMTVTEEARIVLDQIENDITSIDYPNAIDKDRDPDDDKDTYALNDVITCDDDNTSNRKDSGDCLTILCSRPGKLSQFSKIIYEYSPSEYKLTLTVVPWEEELVDVVDKKTGKTEKALVGDWARDKKEERTLLENVIDFNVSIETYDYDNLQYPKKVTIEIQLLDDETRKLGYKSYQDAENQKIDMDLIEKRLGANGKEALKARFARFSRVVSLPPPEM